MGGFCRLFLFLGLALAFLVMSVTASAQAELRCQLPDIQQFGYFSFDGAPPCECDPQGTLGKWLSSAKSSMDTVLISKQDQKRYVRFMQLHQFFKNQEDQPTRCSDKWRLRSEYRRKVSNYGRGCTNEANSFSEKMCKKVMQAYAQHLYLTIQESWGEEVALKKQVSAWSLMLAEKERLKTAWRWCQKAKALVDDLRWSVTGCNSIRSVLDTIALTEYDPPPPTDYTDEMADTIDKRAPSIEDITDIHDMDKKAPTFKERCKAAFGHLKRIPIGAKHAYTKCVGAF